jgi:hypothetical protein
MRIHKAIPIGNAANFFMAVNNETFELLAKTSAEMRANGSLERIFSRRVDKRIDRDMLIEKSKP